MLASIFRWLQNECARAEIQLGGRATCQALSGDDDWLRACGV